MTENITPKADAFDTALFAERLKNHRKLLNLTQDDVAQKIGVSPQAVSKWENGECLPDCYNLKLLGNIYGVSLDILLDTEKSDDRNTVVSKIKQLSTEFIWNKYGKDDKNSMHLELGDDLWEMWKSIYFVEIGNRELQDREMDYGSNRISGNYGAKFWHDAGVACVVKSSLRDRIDSFTPESMELLNLLISEDYFTVLKNMDCHYISTRERLVEKSGFAPEKVTSILMDLMEKDIVEYFRSIDGTGMGYKLTVQKGSVFYVILSVLYLFSEKKYSISEYCTSQYIPEQ